jgi:hypothetical protein
MTADQRAMCQMIAEAIRKEQAGKRQEDTKEGERDGRKK